MKIQRFICNMLQENCYVVSDETNECMIVDCGAFYKEERNAIADYIDSNHLKPVLLVATHGHLDHNFGNKFILDKYGLRVAIHHADKNLLANATKQAAKFYGFKLEEEVPKAGKLLCDDSISGENLTSVAFGNHTFTVIETPGHSRGSIFLYSEKDKVAFSGDTLFRNSIGRTDFDEGSMFMIIQSLRNICQLPDDTQILPGHGDTTTIGEELAHNPYLDR